MQAVVLRSREHVVYCYFVVCMLASRLMFKVGSVLTGFSHPETTCAAFCQSSESHAPNRGESIASSVKVELQYWSGTPPVETTTSRNKNARKISQNVRGQFVRNLVEICRILRNLWGFPRKFCKMLRAFLFRLVVVSTGGVPIGCLQMLSEGWSRWQSSGR